MMAWVCCTDSQENTVTQLLEDRQHTHSHLAGLQRPEVSLTWARSERRLMMMALFPCLPLTDLSVPRALLVASG